MSAEPQACGVHQAGFARFAGKASKLLPPLCRLASSVQVWDAWALASTAAVGNHFQSDILQLLPEEALCP